MDDEREARRDDVAAVDLGSNSFHMIIAREARGELEVIDRLKEPVRLAEGLTKKGRISADAQRRALDCLERFGERLADIPAERIRAVGTNTLRKALNAESFRAKANGALGHPIEIVSGLEEARLIYLGVTSRRPREEARRLVVDIGGGSTEMIVGEGAEILRAHSLFMGCVNWSARFFATGELTRETFKAAEVAARLELVPLIERLRALGFARAIGASGTVHACLEGLRAHDAETSRLDLAGLKRLRRALIAAGSTATLSLPGLRAERIPVLPGGLAILIAVFKALGLEEMEVSDTAMREGVLEDLVGRLHHDDARERTIRRFVERYGVDTAQAERIETTASTLLSQVAPAWALDDEDARLALGWAARLREIGVAVSHTGYHKHGAYLVAHAEMPGFSKDEQRLIAALIRMHRRRLATEVLATKAPERAERALRLAVVLRLACRLHRSRSSEPLPRLQLEAKGNSLRLALPEEWLERRPLLRADLADEAERLAAAGFRLRVAELSPWSNAGGEDQAPQP